MIKTEAVPSTKIVCGQCKDNLDCCDKCESWFMCGDEVHHEDYAFGDKHYCKDCKDTKDDKPVDDNLVIGDWKCEKSPRGVCCYQHDKDPAHDECIYCGHPEERK